MNKQKRGFDPLSDKQRTNAIEHIQTFFKKNHDMDMGLIAAEEILDFHLQLLGRPLFEKGVMDAKKLLTDRIELLNIDLDLLTDK